MMASGAQNVAVESALVAAEFDLRAAAPDIAADLLDRAGGTRRPPDERGAWTP